MFKSLRKKFIATAVGSVAVVIAILAIALNFINFNKLEERIDTTLLDASRSQALIKIFSEDGDDLVITKNSSSATEYNGFSIAKVDNNGRIIKAYRDDSLIADQDTLQSKVIEALEKGKTSGFIGSYRFLKVETNVGNLILFLNCQRELDSYESFVKNSVLISIGVILSILVLIILISKKVIAPIQETYLKQKQFITGASHELKTPLAIISSNADVLEMMMNGDSKWTTNIHNQVDRLTSLVNSLVVFSRMEEKDTVERTSFDLTETLKSRIEDFDELANFQKKYIVTDIDENLNYYGEKDSIIQLMDILLENAIKYAPEDSDILVKLNKNRKYATLKVSNKANVEKGDLSKVFDRFYRLDESRNSAIKGYGIGLSMAQLIAEKHKETIQAYAPEDGVFKIEVRFTLVDR